MSRHRRTRNIKNTTEGSNILVYMMLILLFYPPLVRGLFFSKELLVTHILTAGLFMAVVYFKPDFRPMQIFGNPMDFAALALLAVYLLTSFNAAVPRDAVKELLKTANYIMVYYLVAYYAYDVKNIKRMLETFYASGILVALIGILSILGLNIEEGIRGDRISSTLQYPNTMAAYMLAIFLVGVYLYIKDKSKTMSHLIAAGNFLIFLTLLWTKSRGGFLFIPVSILLMLAGYSERRKLASIHVLISILISTISYGFANSASAGMKFIILLLGVTTSVIINIVVHKISEMNVIKIKKWHYGVAIGIIAIGFVIMISATPVGNKLSSAFSRITTTSIQERNVQERLIFYKDALKVAKDRLILGYGGGGWAGVYQKYQSYAYTSREVHNNYLQLLIETGLIGLIVYAGLWIGFISTVIKNKKTSDRDSKMMNWLALTVALTIGLNAMIDFNLTFGAISMILWSMFGIVRGLSVNINKADKNDKRIVTTGQGGARIVSLTMSGAVLAIALILLIGLGRGDEGLSQFNYDRYDDAKQNLSVAEKFDPLNGKYKMALAEIWSTNALAQKDKEMFAIASAYADSAVKLEQYNPDVHIIKGKNCLKSEQVAEAVTEYETAVSLAPTNQKYYNQLADVCLRAGKYYAYLGDKDKARNYLEKALGVAKLIEEKAKDIPFSKDMPWIKEQYDLTADNKDLQKILQEATNDLGGL